MSELVMKYQQYAEYKDSGVEWLGKIPSSWRTGSLRWMIDIASGESLPSNCEKEYSKENQFPVVGGNGVMGFSNKVNTADAAIAVGRVGALCGNIHSIDYDSWITDNALKISKWNKFSKDFLVYLLKTANLNDLASKTAQPLITGEQVKSLKVVLLPIAEQTQIANFLDHETAQIDTLIEKQQILIQLLKEKRQAVISHAVTKGLNPDAPMKDSGVEWLGAVPEHWELVPLKYLCNFSGGGTPTKDNLSYWTGGTIPWVSPKDMKSFWIDKTQDYITENAVKESSTKLIKAGALLMVVRSGILQRTIPIAINTVDVTMNQDMRALQFNERMTSEYAANYIVGNVDKLLFAWSKEGATVESIEQEYLSNSLFPVPSIKEQHQIVLEINEQMKTFDNLVSKAKIAIQLMQERRTALISAAVTGKIDVRGWRAAESNTVLESL